MRSKRRLAVVPGGGRFAEAVREEQRREGFSDRSAHRMAILAMHQMAELYFEMQPGLAAAETIEEIERTSGEGRVPVWLPYRMAAHEAGIPEDWSITSDGLAAWLAVRLRADVALVKSCPVDPVASASGLAESGVVDTAFAQFVDEAALTWHVLGPSQMAELSAILKA
jgi:aspartokinase-like uncharacterized kinase